MPARRRLWRTAGALVLAAALQAAPAQAQPATLVADRMDIVGETIIAEGNVEVLYDGQRLRAERIVYDRAANRLRIEGDMVLVAEDGTVIRADRADLSEDLESGIMESARIVLDEQMQIAAVEAHRVGGRYNQLYRSVASSCRVCGDGPPLWQIRSRRMVHDEEGKQLYFYDAYFDIGGVPVMYFPRLRLPGPTQTRSTGFLIPEYVRSGLLGFGVKAPYFWAISDHADLTFTPYIAEDTRTLELRYRQAFRRGSMTIDGAISDDDLRPGQLRWYIDANASFRLPWDFDLNLGTQLASDNTYASEYGYSGSDRLLSFGEITRTRRDEHILLGVTSYLPLSTANAASEVTSEALYDRRFVPAGFGGEGRLTFDVEAPGNGVGRDDLHAHGALGWRQNWTLGPGVLGAVEGQVALDHYSMRPGSGFAPEITNVTPTAAAELRWPLARTTAGGGTSVLEPVAQLAWTGTDFTPVPNEDSRLAEFDEGNLLALSRFPGEDRYERGLRGAVGLSWSHVHPEGWSYGASLGRVFRETDYGQFSRASGLDGLASDWLVSGSVEFGLFEVTNRTIVDDGTGVTKSASRLGVDWAGLSLSTGYVWQVADAAEGRAAPLSELAVTAGYEFNRHWTGGLNYRYDFIAANTSEAGLNLVYNNECIRVGLSWQRRNVISTRARSNDSFGVTVALNGVGNDGRPFRRGCRS